MFFQYHCVKELYHPILIDSALKRGGQVKSFFSVVFFISRGWTTIKSCEFSFVQCNFQVSLKHIWMFPKIRVSQNGWFIMENLIKVDDLGVPLFLETSMWLWNRWLWNIWRKRVEFHFRSHIRVVVHPSGKHVTLKHPDRLGKACGLDNEQNFPKKPSLFTVRSYKVGPYQFWIQKHKHAYVLGGGFKYFLFSPRSLGKWSNLTTIFQRGWNHQLDIYIYVYTYINPPIWWENCHYLLYWWSLWLKSWPLDG